MYFFHIQICITVNISSQEGDKAATKPVKQVAPTLVECPCLVPKKRWRVVNVDFVIFLYFLILLFPWSIINFGTSHFSDC